MRRATMYICHGEHIWFAKFLWMREDLARNNDYTLLPLLENYLFSIKNEAFVKLALGLFWFYKISITTYSYNRQPR